jgi:hypothetical protein
MSLTSQRCTNDNHPEKSIALALPTLECHEKNFDQLFVLKLPFRARSISSAGKAPTLCPSCIEPIIITTILVPEEDSFVNLQGRSHVSTGSNHRNAAKYEAITAQLADNKPGSRSSPSVQDRSEEHGVEGWTMQISCHSICTVSVGVARKSYQFA